MNIHQIHKCDMFCFHGFSRLVVSSHLDASWIWGMIKVKAEPQMLMRLDQWSATTAPGSKSARKAVSKCVLKKFEICNILSLKINLTLDTRGFLKTLLSGAPPTFKGINNFLAITWLTRPTQQCLYKNDNGTRDIKGWDPLSYI